MKQVNEISLGLIGFPLGHSYSPVLHQAALEATGLSGSYRLYEIQPGNFEVQVQKLLEQMQAGSLQGLNVTIPFKETIVISLDRLTPTAKAIGAVNTIFIQDSMLVGHNTDAPALQTDLTRKGLLDSTGTALILGAGGAARAAAYTLLLQGWQIVIASRRLLPAQQIQQAFSTQFSKQDIQIKTLSAETLGGMIADFKLVVNATPAGMAPHADRSPWPEGLPYTEKLALYDMIYNPRKTQLMALAESCGCMQVFNGLGMLVEQAALAFECWTNREAPREAMLTQISNHLDDPTS